MAAMAMLTSHSFLVLTIRRWLHTVWQARRAMDARLLVSVEFFTLADPILRIDIQRLLEALVRLIMVAQQVLQILLLHLLLVGNWLQHARIVLWSPQVYKHRRVNRRVMRRLLLNSVIAAAHWALLRATDARRNYEIEAELARLDLFLMVLTEGTISITTLLFATFPLADIYLLKLSLITTAVSQFRVSGSRVGVGLALAWYR